MAKAQSVILATLKDHVGIDRHRIIWEGGTVYSVHRDAWPATENLRHEWHVFGVSDSYAGALRIVAADLEKRGD
jgi:hypothetical protein